jgi:hypothetical protein
VLKDIWQLEADEVYGINHWAARALIRAAIEEAAE